MTGEDDLPPTPALEDRGVPLCTALEAILFSSNRPLRLRDLQQATDADRTAVEQGLDELRRVLDRRGIMVQSHGDLVQLVTRPEVAIYVRRALRPEVTGRLSPAAYETLAIVAYQQPVTRGRIEEVRGVNSDSVLANLELRDLVVEVGRGTGPGQPKLYGTTMRFLQVMGLESLEQLPAPGGIDNPPPEESEEQKGPAATVTAPRGAEARSDEAPPDRAPDQEEGTPPSPSE